MYSNVVSSYSFNSTNTKLCWIQVNFLTICQRNGFKILLALLVLVELWVFFVCFLAASCLCVFVFTVVVCMKVLQRYVHCTNTQARENGREIYGSSETAG